MSLLKKAPWASLLIVPTLFFVSPLLFASGSPTNVSELASSLKTQFNAVTMLISVGSYVAGVGFALAGILQFKAHKDNPQQIPLSKPIVLIAVASCLLFLPTIINIAGKSMFGEDTTGAGSSSKYTGGLGSS